MSARHRPERNKESAERSADHEFFPTPAWVADAVLPHILPGCIGLDAQGPLRVLDPAVGEGHLLERVRGAIEATQDRTPVLSGLEISPERAATALKKGIAVSCRDALDPEPWPQADLVILNPPFSAALAFAQRAVENRRGYQTVAMLARLAFLEAQERTAFHQTHPADVFVFSKRPGFLTQSGKTDMSAYAWFVWGPGRGGRWWVLPHAPQPSKKRAP